MMLLHNIVRAWIVTKAAVVGKLFMLGAFGVVGLIEAMLGLTPSGQTQAACTPTNNGVEICDTVDNDCDNLTDE